MALPDTPPDTPPDAAEPILAIENDPPVKVPLALEDWLAVVVFAILALITFANVLVRYFSNQSFAWTEEISIFLLVVMTMAGGSAAFVRNHHIRIEAFADSGSPRRQRRLALAAQSVVLLFFVLLTVVSIKLVSDEFVYEETSPAIGVPMWWYTVWLPIMSAVISLRTLGVLLRLWRGEK